MAKKFEHGFYTRSYFFVANPDKYSHSGYGIGFDTCSDLSINAEFGKNVIFLGIDNNSSVHVDNRKNRYLNSSWRFTTKTP